MKIKLDEKYLNAIKNKLIASLKLSPKVIECMNSGSISFYLENLKETRDAAMMSFSTHISIDKSFFDFDDNGYVLGFKKSKTKIIRSQLGHELLHAASGNREYSGINKLSDDKKRGLNEGITQMYTEDVFGYVVSHFSDGYRDYKKIAKIIRLCVGDDPVKKSYFEHTNDLDIACANLSGDYAFFDELNQILTDLYYMKKIAKKASKAGKIELKKIYYERVKVSFASVIVNLVVPKLKSIKSADERRNFIKSIFLVIDDDINIVRMVRNLMINELSMSPEELEREKISIKKYDLQQQSKIHLIEMINNNSLKDGSLQVDDDGNIKYKDSNGQWIKVKKDDDLRTLIYNSLYDKNVNSSFNINEFFKKLLKDKEITFPKDMSLKTKKIILACLKTIALDNDYQILTEYDEITGSPKLQVDIIHSNPKFDDLRLLVERYIIENEFSDDYGSNLVIRNRHTRKIIEDVYLINDIRMAYVWLGTYQHSYSNEIIPGLLDAYSEDSKAVYIELMSLIKDNIEKTGEMNMRQISAYAEKHKHSRMKKAVNHFLAFLENYDIVYGFVKKRISNGTLQAEKENTNLYNLYQGYDDRVMNDAMIDVAVEDVLKPVK